MDKNDLYYNTGKDYLSHQDDLHKEFSDKATAILGFSVAITSAGVIALNIGNGQIPEIGTVLFWITLLSLAVWGVGFLAVVGFSALVLAPRKQNWKHGTGIESIGKLINDESITDAKLYWSVADDFRESIKDNTVILEGKAMYVRRAVYSIAFQVLGMVTLVVLILLTN